MSRTINIVYMKTKIYGNIGLRLSGREEEVEYEFGKQLIGQNCAYEKISVKKSKVKESTSVSSEGKDVSKKKEDN